ncbi:MAG: hypothetical protein Q8M24_24045 [Pseudolabrys sp.]|nr:hypothetical protein [Pseudolabrys sp.]MDP2298522.1 hypothetical protein [Pseudolabrys sp.]
MPPRFLLSTAFLPALAIVLTAGAPAVAQNGGMSQGDYQARLAAYLQVRQPYEEQAAAYWDEVAAKRRIRNEKRRNHAPVLLEDYVLEHPPVYSGPPRPVDPSASPGPAPGEPPPIPVLADFLRHAKDHFGFVPDRPSNELDFKRAYAKAANEAGLTREQIVGIYIFETGGNGTYDMQAGVTPTRPRAISPAVGYNQLLSTNTASILHEHGNRILSVLRAKAKTLSGPAKLAMERKIEATKRMIAHSRTVPLRWSELDKMAKNTAPGIGLHAAILDRDIGPMLQVQKLATSVHFARMKGYAKPLSASELELMNLTGDSTGLDMVMMPANFRARVPTANFFQQRGYERNPVARRTGVVAKLIADMENQMARGAQNPGARDLAAAF